MSKNNLQPGMFVAVDKSGNYIPATNTSNNIIGAWNGISATTITSGTITASRITVDMETKRKKQTLKCSKCEKILGEYYAWQDSYECLDNIGSKEARDILCQDCYLLEKLKE